MTDSQADQTIRFERKHNVGAMNFVDKGQITGVGMHDVAANIYM